jgi:hypothetical protein
MQMGKSENKEKGYKICLIYNNYQFTADLENAGDSFFAGKLLYGPFQGIF